jgi:hypothetical protein
MLKVYLAAVLRSESKYVPRIFGAFLVGMSEVLIISSSLSLLSSVHNVIVSVAWVALFVCAL